ncbi:MAG: hypothetical protein U1B80_05605, partial [Anaerolineaceae bacterium]|nr:hypothetical protein [Anaerolineaceae bacterium]
MSLPSRRIARIAFMAALAAAALLAAPSLLQRWSQPLGEPIALPTSSPTQAAVPTAASLVSDPQPITVSPTP